MRLAIILCFLVLLTACAPTRFIPDVEPEPLPEPEPEYRECSYSMSENYQDVKIGLRCTHDDECAVASEVMELKATEAECVATTFVKDDSVACNTDNDCLIEKYVQRVANQMNDAYGENAFIYMDYIQENMQCIDSTCWYTEGMQWMREDQGANGGARYLPDRCVISVGSRCMDFLYADNEIQMRIQNMHNDVIGGRVVITSDDCAEITSTVEFGALAKGDTVEVALPCTTTVDQVSGILQVIYDVEGGGGHIDNGEFAIRKQT